MGISTRRFTVSGLWHLQSNAEEGLVFHIIKYSMKFVRLLGTSVLRMTSCKQANRIHGNSDYTRMPPDSWSKSWKEGKTFWHRPAKNEFLERHLDDLLNGRQTITIFFPFCGKAVDMKWLYDEGHNVVGIDCAQQPIEEFFKDHEVECIKEKIENLGTLYRSKDSRLRIYHGNLMDMTVASCGTFNAIWDRGALVAVDKEERKGYADTLLSLFGEGCRYMIEASEYHESEYVGPPHTISAQDVEDLFGTACDIKIAWTKDVSEEYNARFNTTKWIKTLYLLTKKQ